MSEQVSLFCTTIAWIIALILFFRRVSYSHKLEKIIYKLCKGETERTRPLCDTELTEKQRNLAIEVFWKVDKNRTNAIQ